MLAMASTREVTAYLDRYPKKYLWVVAVLIGTLARIMVASLGHNGDYDFWIRHAEVIRNGGNLYEGGESYGYGPVWMFVLRFADLVQNILPENRKVFRLVIILVLTLADLLIATIIAKKFSHYAALLFFINPVSIIITGYHNQFDNIAIGAGLLAIIILTNFHKSEYRKFYWAGLILLGLSIAIKQVLIFFPFWLLLRAGTLRQKISRLVVPYLVFCATFLPWATSLEKIEVIVGEIFPRRGRSGLLLTLLGAEYDGTIRGTRFDDLAHHSVSAIFVLIVVLLGWLMRRRCLFDSVIIYLVAIVAFAPAYSQQQLILPLIALFVYATIELKIFYLLTLLFMVQNSDELGYEFLFPHFFRLNGTIYAWLQVLLLIFALRLLFPNHPQNRKSRHLQTALKLE
jgi:4-amino-4-deoxy-L-arabinose transferase-like glycosyltransferase